MYVPTSSSSSSSSSPSPSLSSSPDHLTEQCSTEGLCRYGWCKSPYHDVSTSCTSCVSGYYRSFYARECKQCPPMEWAWTADMLFVCISSYVICSALYMANRGPSNPHHLPPDSDDDEEEDKAEDSSDSEEEEEDDSNDSKKKKKKKVKHSSSGSSIASVVIAQLQILATILPSINWLVPMSLAYPFDYTGKLFVHLFHICFVYTFVFKSCSICCFTFPGIQCFCLTLLSCSFFYFFSQSQRPSSPLN